MNIKKKDAIIYKNDTPDDGNYYNIMTLYRFEGGDWISLVIGGGSANWELRVRGNLTYREDTGLLNSSPVVNISPLIRIQNECSHTIKIPGIYSLS
jgi:hypothetical protein